MKAETFYEGDNPLSYTDENYGIAAKMEQENRVQEEAVQSRNSVITDFEGQPLFVVSSRLGNCTVVPVVLCWKNRVLCCFLHVSYALHSMFDLLARLWMFGNMWGC